MILYHHSLKPLLFYWVSFYLSQISKSHLCDSPARHLHAYKLLTCQNGNPKIMSTGFITVSERSTVLSLLSYHIKQVLILTLLTPQYKGLGS